MYQFKKIVLKSSIGHRWESWFDFGIKRSHCLVSLGMDKVNWLILVDGNPIYSGPATFAECEQKVQDFYEEQCRKAILAIIPDISAKCPVCGGVNVSDVSTERIVKTDQYGETEDLEPMDKCNDCQTVF